MGYNLCIEIEAPDENNMYSLLSHIFNEIVSGPDYRDAGLEANAKPEEDWLVVTQAFSTGRYKWRKIIE